MKISGIITASVFAVFLIFLTIGCKSKKETKPCDNKGKVCIENKLDSTMTVNILQMHYQFQIARNYIKCVELEGNQPYKFTFTGPNHDIRDTTFIVVACDNVLITLQ